MYLKIENNGDITYPYSLDDLKRENTTISFPKNLTEEILATFSVYQVDAVDIEDDYTKNIIEGTPIQSGSKYIQNWVITDATTEEINQRIEEKWYEVRIQRNNLLTESDWTQIQDSPITGSLLDDWKSYRQNLRDITSQSDPFNINWPVQP